ncbi:MAG: hypothetical protein PHD68_10315 [Rugosibacter sp.]|nr:hypothetical protein [Rugosibacter sp.]MDD3381580.1 hypothetical protein [Rugosibacter sp.]
MTPSTHDQIKADAIYAKAQAKQCGPVPYSEFDSLKNLIDSATDAICANLPASFEHCGKTYRLVTDIQRLRVAIFNNPAATESLLVALVCLPGEEGGRNGQATN